MAEHPLAVMCKVCGQVALLGPTVRDQEQLDNEVQFKTMTVNHGDHSATYEKADVFMVMEQFPENRETRRRRKKGQQGHN